MTTAGSRPRRRSRPGEEAAIALARDLAGTLGPVARVHVCRLRPAELLRSWGPLRRASDDASVLEAVADAARDERVVNRPLGRGLRVSVLPLPGTEASGLAIAVEVDGAPLARAARLLVSLADPDAERTESPEHLGETLDRMLDAAEQQVGIPVPDMSRSQKQQVVRYLDDRGAFLIKKSVEQVAARLGVSRFTIYNYLDESNRNEHHAEDGRSE